MAKAALFMGPMARKKSVNEKYCPNSYRVISVNAEGSDPTKFVSTCTSTADFNMLGQPAEKFAWNEHRHNRPNPESVGFLRQDVHLLNEPICYVRTSSTAKEQQQWWPSRTSDAPLRKPPRTLDTTVRGDFQFRGKGQAANTRHSSNPNARPALGSVPVNFLREPDGSQRFWKEGISYEHQYNCRMEPQYPIRAKRHGAFVWDRFASTEVDRMLSHYDIVTNKGQTNSGQKIGSPVPVKETSQAPISSSLDPSMPKPAKDEGRHLVATSENRNLTNTSVLPPIGY